MTRSHKKILRPTIVGAGLLALDVIVNEMTADDPKHYAGGTCGNVLTILSFLGWEARPVARLKDDVLAEWLLQDLEEWSVDTSFISQSSDGSTPVIIERIREASDGTPYHSYSLRCPCCGAYLPGYKAIRGQDTDRISESLSTHQVFFFDRVSRGTLNLAKASAENGALVVFEPSGVGDARLFREAWSLSHIVKYSNDRLRDIADIDLNSEIRNDLLLEIETLGAAGLRFRSRLPGSSSSRWKTLHVIPTPTFKDAAGSGDWCTAGILHKLARGGRRGFRRVDEDRLEAALRYGQALATWNCSFESARGGMYEVSRAQFDRQIRALLNGKSIRIRTEGNEHEHEDLARLCPACEEFRYEKTGTTC
jgi:fructokinase